MADDNIEQALITCLAQQFGPPLDERLRTEAREREAQAETIRQILKRRMSFSLD